MTRQWAFPEVCKMQIPKVSQKEFSEFQKFVI